MIRYVTFKKIYKSIFAQYKFYPQVKYKVKGENNEYYFTIKNVKLSKKLEHRLYEINSAI